ncbi:hypothetical protein [uncultured Chryseobacterium sp.]|nr:hypothetical protein [uncultured Chryseobacterium sp.]
MTLSCVMNIANPKWTKNVYPDEVNASNIMILNENILNELTI